ncbi:hypothetical protein AAFF_G00387340, partial [Aldrovandia affinis]
GGEDGRRGDRGGAVLDAAPAGEAGEAVAVLEAWPLQLVGGGERRGSPALLCVVDEVAAWAVGAEPDGVEGAAQLGLVLGVAAQAAQLVDAVGELTLVAVLAGAVLLEGPAQFRLVAAGIHLPLAAGAVAALLQQPLSGLGVRPVPESVLFVAATSPPPPPEESEGSTLRLLRNWFWLNLELGSVTECRRWYGPPTEGVPTAFLSSRAPVVVVEMGGLPPVQGTDISSDVGLGGCGTVWRRCAFSRPGHGCAGSTELLRDLGHLTGGPDTGRNENSMVLDHLQGKCNDGWSGGWVKVLFEVAVGVQFSVLCILVHVVSHIYLNPVNSCL